MIHIDYTSLPLTAQRLAAGRELAEDRTGAVCRAELGEGDTLTETALASNCDACRLAINVGGVNDKGGDGRRVGVKPVPVFEPGACSGPGKPEPEPTCDGQHELPVCGDPCCRLICDECDGSGTYYIDGEPQTCICKEPQT